METCVLNKQHIKFLANVFLITKFLRLSRNIHYENVKWMLLSKNKNSTIIKKKQRYRFGYHQSQFKIDKIMNEEPGTPCFQQRCFFNKNIFAQSCHRLRCIR